MIALLILRYIKAMGAAHLGCMLLAVITTVSCSGGGQVGTGGDYSQVQLSGVASVDGEPIAGAAITVYADDAEASGTTDVDGRYEITISANEAQLQSLARIDVTKSGSSSLAAASSDKHLRLVSVLGSLQKLRLLASEGNVVTETAAPQLSINSYTTAEYAAIKLLNGGNEVDTEAAFDLLKSQVNAVKTVRLAALLDLAYQSDAYDLPPSAEDTLALVQSDVIASVEIGRWNQLDAEQLPNQATKVSLRQFGDPSCDVLVPNAQLRGCDLSGKTSFAADLTGADLSFSKLVESRFQNLNMANVNFSLANGSKVTFSDVNISGANFSFTALPKSTFASLSSDNIKFDSGIIANSIFTATSFSASSFMGANLSGSAISQSTFTNADFSNADLSGVSFDHVALDGANFSGAILRGATFSNVSVAGVDWTGAVCPDGSLSNGACDLAPASTPDCAHPAPAANLQGCNFAYQNFAGLDLSGANLQNAFLQGASLLNTNLSNANLTNAILQSAALQAATLDGANLSSALLNYASLAGASLKTTNFTDADISDAMFGGAVFLNTICPDGSLTSVLCM